MLSTLRLGSHSFCDLCHRASSEQWNTSTFDFHSNNHRHQIERLCSRFTIPEHRMTTRMTSMNTKCRRPWHVVEGTAIVLRRVFYPCIVRATCLSDLEKRWDVPQVAFLTGGWHLFCEKDWQPWKQAGHLSLDYKVCDRGPPCIASTFMSWNGRKFRPNIVPLHNSCFGQSSFLSLAVRCCQKRSKSEKM